MAEVVKSQRDHFYDTIKWLRKANKALEIVLSLKGIVYSEMKILSLFVLSHAVPNLYDCPFFYRKLPNDKKGH